MHWQDVFPATWSILWWCFMNMSTSNLCTPIDIHNSHIHYIYRYNLHNIKSFSCLCGLFIPMQKIHIQSVCGFLVNDLDGCHHFGDYVVKLSSNIVVLIIYLLLNFRGLLAKIREPRPFVFFAPHCDNLCRQDPLEWNKESQRVTKDAKRHTS